MNFDEWWEMLSRPQQRRILREMGRSTTKAMFMDYDTLERILNGFFEGAKRVKRPAGGFFITAPRLKKGTGKISGKVKRPPLLI